MKKRVLSLLLMLVMVMAAVPLFAFSAFAAEPEEEIVDFNYDALYATDGLVFAIDFFKSNVFWDPEGDDYNYYVSPTENSAYVYQGQTYDFTNPDNRVSGTELSAAFKDAIKNWKGTSATGTERLFLNTFVTCSVNSTYAFSYVPGETAANAGYFHSSFYLKDGYIQIREDTHSSGGFQLGALGDTNFTDNVAMHVVYDISGVAPQKNPYVIWHNIRPAFTTVEGDTKLTALLDSTATFVANGDITSQAFDFSGLNNLVFSLTGGQTEGGTEDTFAISSLDGELASVKGTYTGSKNFKNTVYFGWNDTMNDGKIYAIRQYNKGLSQEGFRQNTFADLCKWYKLDMGIYDSLTTAQRLSLRETILAFADAQGMEVGDTTKRDALQTKLTNAMSDLVYGQLSQEDPTPAAEAFVQITKAVEADISGVLALPKVYRSAVYAAVNGMTNAQKNNRAMVQAMIDTVVDDVIKTYYGQYINTTSLTYKDLYVRQENLVLWMDFFAAEESDGNLYMEYSYTDEKKDAAGNPISKENWNLPKYKDGNSKNGLNPDRIFIPQVSGEAAAREKYIYKGGSFFQFADIPDASWGHSNIRTWGNGRLVCGKNNSFNVKSPGVEKKQVTYQFVTGWENNDSNYVDEMNVQLDGYRMYFQMDANNTAGMFRVRSYDYYGYGVSTDTVTLNSTALIQGSGTDPIRVGDMLDLTITVDKFIGEDNGHYYMVNYLTNSEGAIQYYRSDVVPTNVNKDSLQKIYRYQIEGAWYYVINEISNNTIVSRKAIYAETMVGKARAIEDTEGKVVTEVPVLGNPGSLTLDWANAVYQMNGSDKVDYNGAVATDVYGPCYRNPFEEVPFGTPGAEGPITYYGTYDLGVYANGQQQMYATGLSYQRSDIGWVGNSGNMTFYAVRTYDCVLTETEMRQNHFADLAGYYGYDLALYALLSDAEREALHSELSNVQLGLSDSEGIAAYEAAIDNYLYAFDASLPGAANFLELCHRYSLDTRELKELSSDSLARIFALFADVDPYGSNHGPIIQKTVVEAVAAEVSQRYAFAYGHKTINFEGWQVRKTGDFGLRALYSTDLSQLAALKASGAKIMTGVLTSKVGQNGISSLNDLTVTVQNGEVVAPEGVTLVKGYWDGVIGETAIRNGNTLYFTYDTYLGVEGADSDTVTDALKEKYFYTGFTVIMVGNEYCIFYDDATVAGASGSQSVFTLSRTAQKNKMSEPNIMRAMNVVDEETFIAIETDGRTLSDYKMVLSGARDEAAAVQNVIKQAMGFELDSIRAADAAGKTGFIYIGAMDNVYDDKCYGISFLGGNIYFWYNNDATAADACALFIDYVNAKIQSGEDVVFPKDFEIVRRVQS